MHLPTWADRRRTFERIAAALRPGGRFAWNAFVFDPHIAGELDGHWQEDAPVRHRVDYVPADTRIDLTLDGGATIPLYWLTRSRVGRAARRRRARDRGALRLVRPPAVRRGAARSSSGSRGARREPLRLDRRALRPVERERHRGRRLLRRGGRAGGLAGGRARGRHRPDRGADRGGRRPRDRRSTPRRGCSTSAAAARELAGVADLLDLRLGELEAPPVEERVALVTCPFRSFLHLLDDDVAPARARRGARAARCRAGGWCSTSSPRAPSDIADTHGRWLEREPGIFERADWDSQARTLTLSVRGESGETSFVLAWLSNDEWRALLERAGFQVRRLLRLVRPPPVRAAARTRSGSRAGRSRAARPGRRRRPRRTRRSAPASRACPAAPRAGPSRSSSMRWQGSQTIVISKTASSPTFTRWPIGHCSTSVPSTVRFSRIAPGSTPTESRCSVETNSTSRFGGFAWAQPSRPSPGSRAARGTDAALAPVTSRPVILASGILPRASCPNRRAARRPSWTFQYSRRSKQRRRRELQQQAAGSVIVPSSRRHVVHHSTRRRCRRPPARPSAPHALCVRAAPVRADASCRGSAPNGDERYDASSVKSVTAVGVVLSHARR